MEYTLDWVANKLDESMPSLSPTSSKVLQLANDINCPPSELTRVIKMDPVLSAKVLRLVNSSYFSLSTKIVSLEKAVILMGMNTIKNLALSTAVMAQVQEGQQQDDPIANADFWKHSLAVGVVAKEIALQKGVGKKEVEDYFLAGLLHRLGLLVESRIFSEHMLGILLQASEDGLIQAEEAALEGLNHCKIGGVLAARWSLAPELTQVMSSYAVPEIETSDEHVAPLTLTVHIASIICRNHEIGQVLDPLPISVDEAVRNRLPVTEELEKSILDGLDKELVKAVEFLKA